MVLPRFELRLLDSESDVLSTTPWDRYEVHISLYLKSIDLIKKLMIYFKMSTLNPFNYVYCVFINKLINSFFHLLLVHPT